MQFIDLRMQYKSVEQKINARIKAVLEHGKYIMGPEVAELEERLADYAGVKHCISCANGTDALQLALMSQGIGPGDAVFTTPFTFFSTAEVIALVGATPVFVDIDDKTYNISTRKLKEAITEVKNKGELKAKAIIAVDLFGLPADYLELEQIATENDLFLIEDGAQGFGGEIQGQKACSFGDVATTSFFPAKPLGCYGDGGALFTNSSEMAETLKSLRVHGKGQNKYDNVRVGLNSRLDTIQAAILLEKLEIFPEEVVLRNQIAAAYKEKLDDRFILPFVPSGYLSSWAQFTIRPQGNEGRLRYLDRLRERSIPSAVYYGKSLHQQEAFREGCVNHSVEKSESLAEKVFSLPMHPYLKDIEIEKIVEALIDD